MRIIRFATCIALLFSSLAQGQPSARRTVGILVFPGVQVIDFAGPFEVFDTDPSFDVFVVGQSLDPVTAVGGLTVQPKYSFGNHPPIDVLVVPGGEIFGIASDSGVLNWIRRQAERAELTLSVCAGSLLLGRAGLLDGLEATTNYSLLASLRSSAPRARVVADRRFVDNGRIVTAGGLMAGLDASLHVIAKLRGLGVAQRVALSQEYRWDHEGKWTRGTLADRFLPAAFESLSPERPVLQSTEGDSRMWRARWRISSALTDSTLLARAEQSLQRTASGDPVKWTRVRSGQAVADSTSSVWHFADAAGALWRAIVNVQLDVNDRRARLLTIGLEATADTAPQQLRWKPAHSDARLSVGGERMGDSIPASLDTSLVRHSEGGTFRVTLAPVGANRLDARTWRLAIATPDGAAVHNASVIVGGGMPLHGHGMETEPAVTQTVTAGEYRLENVRLGAMGGGRPTWWEIRVLIRAGVVEDLVIFNIVTPGTRR